LARRALWTDLRAHLALRFHDPHDPRAYNIFQKLAYVGLVFVLLPLLILSGLALAPGMWPWIADLFGGRQSARSVHFIAMAATTVFVVVHLTLVILAGPINEVRSMITGWWRAPEEDHS
jgi:thiosulfate reductase cytochrome b subunit